MENSNAEIIFQTRSSFDRRKFMNRRSFLKQEFLSHNPERRETMINRRIIGDRREWHPEIMNTFWKEDA